MVSSGFCGLESDRSLEGSLRRLYPHKRAVIFVGPASVCPDGPREGLFFLSLLLFINIPIMPIIVDMITVVIVIILVTVNTIIEVQIAWHA